MKTTAVVVTYNRLDKLRLCMNALLSQSVDYYYHPPLGGAEHRTDRHYHLLLLKVNWDMKIRYHFRREDEGISLGTKSAIAVPSGQYDISLVSSLGKP